MQIAQACFVQTNFGLLQTFLSRLHVQKLRLMQNFGLNAGVPWLSGTDGALFFICKETLDDVNHFFGSAKHLEITFDRFGLT